ncbi:MAG: M14 family metallopeptidase [Candidatus Methanomethylicia archaeon]
MIKRIYPYFITIVILTQFIQLTPILSHTTIEKLESMDVRSGIYTLYELSDGRILNVTYNSLNKYTKTPLINVTIDICGRTLWAIYNLTNRMRIYGELWNWEVYPLWIPKIIKENDKIQLYDHRVFNVIGTNETSIILSNNETKLIYDGFSGVLLEGEIEIFNETLNAKMIKTNMKFRREYFNNVYFDWKTLTIKLMELESKYKDILKIYSIGKSLLGREIWACEITGIGKEEGVILIDGGMHGSEVIGVRVAYKLLETILEEYNELVGKGLLRNLSIIIIPMLNPDGVEMSKYSPPIPIIHIKDGRCNANGVDLNRNFGYSWTLGGSPYYNSTTYRGEEPESEPEVKALKNILLKRNILFYLNLHSGVKQILIPAYQENPYINVYMEIASTLSNIYGYEIARGGIYGGAANWCLMGRDKPALSIIIELYGGGTRTLEVDWFLFYNPVDISEISKIEILSYQAFIQILLNVNKWSRGIIRGEIESSSQQILIIVIISIAIILTIISSYIMSRSKIKKKIRN